MELITKLGIDPKILLAQIVNFFILFVVLWKVLYKPLRTLMAERAQRIETGIQFASDMTEQKKQWEEEHRRLVSTAQVEMQKMIAGAQAQAKTIEQEAREHARQQIAKLLAQGEQSLRRREQEAMAQLEHKITALVGVVAEKFLEKKMTGEHDEQLVKKLFAAKV